MADFLSVPPVVVHSLAWVFDDGGRSVYFTGSAGDCATRAVAIATGTNYREVYDRFADGMASLKPLRGRMSRGKKSARNGVAPALIRTLMADLGWVWVPTMSIGSGCTVHLAYGEIPMSGPIVARVSKHLCAVVDGVIHDTHDPARGGTRCVYGYWARP